MLAQYAYNIPPLSRSYGVGGEGPHPLITSISFGVSPWVWYVVLCRVCIFVLRSSSHMPGVLVTRPHPARTRKSCFWTNFWVENYFCSGITRNCQKLDKVVPTILSRSHAPPLIKNISVHAPTPPPWTGIVGDSILTRRCVEFFGAGF